MSSRLATAVPNDAGRRSVGEPALDEFELAGEISSEGGEWVEEKLELREWDWREGIEWCEW